MEIAKTTEGQQWDRKEDFFLPISLKKKLTPETLNMLDKSNDKQNDAEKWEVNIQYI